MLRADYPEFHPLAIWPEPGGFLPFASTTYGDEIGWLTIGEPEGWPLLVNPRQSDPGPPLEGSLVEILLSWVRGKPIPCFKNLDPLDDPLEFADMVGALFAAEDIEAALVDAQGKGLWD